MHSLHVIHSKELIAIYFSVFVARSIAFVGHTFAQRLQALHLLSVSRNLILLKLKNDKIPNNAPKGQKYLQ